MTTLERPKVLLSSSLAAVEFMGCRAIPVATSDTAQHLFSSPGPHDRQPARLLISTWADSLKTLSFHWEAKHSAEIASIAWSTLAACLQLQALQFTISVIFFSTYFKVFTSFLRVFEGGKQLQIFCYFCGQNLLTIAKIQTRGSFLWKMKGALIGRRGPRICLS